MLKLFGPNGSRLVSESSRKIIRDKSRVVGIFRVSPPGTGQGFARHTSRLHTRNFYSTLFSVPRSTLRRNLINSSLKSLIFLLSRIEYQIFTMSAEEPPPVLYEDLAAIEDEFEEVDTEISSSFQRKNTRDDTANTETVRKQYALSESIFFKRSAIASKIPNFWPLAIEQAPLEIDNFIQQQDSRLFAESLIDFEIRRPELDIKRSGNPRSISMKLEFKPNSDFEDIVLEKTFWHRRARDGWTGLVSQPVKISWKEGKDLTEGLTDGAVALWEARKKMGDMTAKGLPEYTALKKKAGTWNGANTSFFTLFGFVSGRRWVSAQESEEANQKYAAEKERRKAGEKTVVSDEVADAEAEAEMKLDDEDVEVHEAGEELAIAFAEDLWPNAIKYFTQAQDVEEEMSDIDFEEDEDDAESGDEQPVDIRALVQESKGRSRESAGSAGAPPSKKIKK